MPLYTAITGQDFVSDETKKELPRRSPAYTLQL